MPLASPPREPANAAPLEPKAAHLRIAPRRRVVPGPRAVVGGLLVAVAFIGTYATTTGALGSDERAVLVAARDIQAGTKLSADDVRVVNATIDATTAQNLASSPKQVEGATLLGALKAGEFIQGGNVASKAIASPEVSFAIPRARAVGGELRSGELVDVIATNKGGDSPNARTAISGAKVTKVDKGSGNAIGAGGDVIVTVSVADRAQATNIAAAVDGGQVTLVRTTGLGS